MHRYHRLRDPVCDRRHAQHSDPTTVRLGDLDRSDRRREVGPRAHSIPNLVEVVRKISLELLEILTVHSRRALVRPDLPPRLPDHQLGNRKRLHFGPWHVLSPPPRAQRAPVERNGHSRSAGPFAPPPPQQAGTSPLLRAGPPASAATSTQCLRFPPSARSLSRPSRAYDPGSTLSPLAFSRSMPEPQTRITPPLRRAPPGQ